MYEYSSSTSADFVLHIYHCFGSCINWANLSETLSCLSGEITKVEDRRARKQKDTPVSARHDFGAASTNRVKT